MTAVGTKVFASEYNAIQAAISTVLGTGAGASGYGQTVLSSQVSTSSSITVAQWANLRADLLKAYLHQGTPGDLPLPSVPQKSTLPYTIVTYSDYNRYLDLSNVITANAGVAPPAGQATLQTFSTGSYTSTWNGQLTHSVVLTFATANQARFYFNSGGNIQFSASLINYPGYPGYGSQSASYAKNSDWNMLLNNMGTTTFGRNSTVNSGNGTGQTILSAVGYFQLTTGEQNIYRKTTSSASYTPNQYDLYANVDATGAVITFNIRFKDLSTTSGTGFGATDENVEGSLTSLIQGYYASGSYVAATPPATTAVFAGGAVVAPPPPPPPPPIYEPPPPVVVYNEVVTAPASVRVGTSFGISISGGAPNTTFNFTVTAWPANTTDYSSNGTLNGSGSASVTIPVVNPITNNTIQSSPGDWRYTFVFPGSSNTRIVTVTATANPPNPTVGPFTASPNPAANGQTITLSVTVYNMRVEYGNGGLGFGALNIGVVDNTGNNSLSASYLLPAVNGTVITTHTFTFQQALAPYTTNTMLGSFPGTQISGPTITLYVAPVVTPPSYGAYGWSPAGPVAVGTSATFSAVANNAVGDVYGIGIGTSSPNPTTVTGVITTNPQTVSRTITAAYDAAYPYYNGIFVLSSLSPDIRNVLLTVTAPAAPPPPTPTYSVTGSSSVNEGGTVSVSVTSTNVPNGTSLYWQLTSTITGLTPEADANDFGSTSGSFVINSNAGSFGVGVTADNLTEGTEFRAVRVYSDSGLSNQIGYVVFSISDTSTTPVPSPSYGAYGWSPAGPVVSGTSVTYSAVANNAVGRTYSLLRSYASGGFVVTSSGVVTTNPQTFTDSFTMTYIPSAGYNPLNYAQAIFNVTPLNDTGVVTIEVTANESVTGPSTVTVGNANFNVSLSGGAPFTGFSWTGATSGSGTLDASGNASVPFASGSTIQQPTGVNSFTVTFAATGHVRTYTVTVLAAPPPPPPYVPPAFLYTVTWPGPSWSINVPADGSAISTSVSVYCSSGSGTYDVQETSRPTAVSVAVDGVSGPARITQYISAGQTRSHTVTVYANPPGAGYNGSFSAGGVSYPWTATFRGSPRVTAYVFIPTPTYVGQYVLFAVDVADADGLGWGANVYTNNFYAIGSASGTISGNQLQGIIIGGFYTTAGMNLGTFYLSGVGVVQTQVNL